MDPSVGYQNYYKKEGISYPQSDTNIDWTGGLESGSDQTTKAYNINSIVTEAFTVADKIVQSNAIVIPAAITHHQVYCKNTLAGSGAITYDFSADGGSTWDTNQVLNSKNTFAATPGVSCKIKLNLSGTGAGNNANAENYGIIVWT